MVMCIIIRLIIMTVYFASTLLTLIVQAFYNDVVATCIMTEFYNQVSQVQLIAKRDLSHYVATYVYKL